MFYKSFIFSNMRIVYTLAETHAGVRNWQLICIVLIPNFHAFWGSYETWTLGSAPRVVLRDLSYFCA